MPFTKDFELFKKLGEIGKRLMDLHLMKSDELNDSIAKFQGSGENRIEKQKYEEGEEQFMSTRLNTLKELKNRSGNIRKVAIRSWING